MDLKRKTLSGYGSRLFPAPFGALICLVAFLTVLLVPLNTMAGEKEEVPEKVVRIGWYQSNNFQSGMSDDEPKSGYCYEYIHKVSDYNGWTYEYVYGDWTELYNMLESGEIDVLAGVSKTEERLDKILFPKEAMGQEHYALYQHEDGGMAADDTYTFTGKKIGAIKDNLMTEYLEEWLSENHAEAEVVCYDSFEERDRDFAEGTIDGLVTTSNSVTAEDGYSLVTEVGKEDYYLAVSKDREDLLSDLNRSLDYIEDIEPYFLNNLDYQYYGETLANNSLSVTEEEWVNSHSTLKVGYMEDYLPYCGTDEDGNATGLMTDVCQEILKKLNISDRITVTYQAFPSGADMMDALKNGEIDAAFPVCEDIWQLEREGIRASSTVITGSEYLAYKGYFSDAKTQKIALTTGNALAEQYARVAFPEAEVVYYPSIDDCLEAVKNGEVQSTLINGLRTDLVTENRHYRSLSLKRLNKSDERAFGLAEDNTALQMLLNRGIRLIGTNFATNAAYDYMSSLYQETVAGFLADHFEIFGGLGLLVILIIVILSYENYRKHLQFLRSEKEKNEKLLALNSSLADCRDALEAAGLGMWEFLLDADGTICGMTGDEKLKEIFGMEGKNPTPKEFLDHLVAGLANKEDDPTQYNYAGLELGAVTRFTFSWKHPQKGLIYVESAGTTRIGADGTMKVSGYAADVTKKEENIKAWEGEILKAKEEAEEANNAKTNFLFNMSHDIRTPMNAIMGFRDLLEKHQEDPEKRADYLKKIKDASSVLLSIINNVLEMARIEKGTIDLEENAGSADQFMDSIYSVFKEMMEQKNITFTREVKVKHPYVYSDVTRMREIYINILGNAYKYTNSGGSVDFCLEEIPSGREGWALYRGVVTDTGIGMSEDFLPHVFDAFSREKNTTDAKIEGTGLGMSIVKKLVEMMDGTIEVKSKKGQGTTFTVTLYHRIADREELPADRETESDVTSFEGKRILLAEDNELNAEIACEILKEAGFQVDRVEDGAKCLEKLRKAQTGTYDLILMDVQMPNMNGYEATRAIRSLEDPEKAKIPIIAMTANAFEEDRRNALAAGMNDHLAKPIDISKMLKMLGTVLGENS